MRILNEEAVRDTFSNTQCRVLTRKKSLDANNFIKLFVFVSLFLYYKDQVKKKGFCWLFLLLFMNE